MRIYYNFLNLPDSIVFAGRGKVVNRYLADGTLLERREMDFSTGEVEKVNYEGLFLFWNDTLQYVFTDEGYVQNGEYHYVLVDQTQSTRAIINENGEVTQRNNYYAYGAIIRELSFDGKYPFNFGGKEKINTFGAGYSDFHARMFNTSLIDPPISWQLDGHAENFYAFSPYGLFGGNPISRVDPTGLDWFYNEQSGEIFYHSSFSRGAEEQMTAGWQWMGANDMFYDEDNPQSDDLNVLINNGNLTDGTLQINSIGKEMSVSAFFQGGNGKKFMEGQGYDFMPTQQVRYESNLSYAISQKGRPDLNITHGEKIYITEKSAYFPIGAVEKRTQPINDLLWKPGALIQTVNRFQISYSNHWFLRGLTKFDSYMQSVYGNQDTRGTTIYNGWQQYPKNNSYINDFND